MKIYNFKGKSLLSKIISLVTRGPYSHTGIEVNGYYYECWSIKGIRDSKVIKSLHWSENHLPNTEVDTIEIYGNYNTDWLEERIGYGYDFKGLFGYLDNSIKEDNKKYYCSELVYKYLVHLGILKEGEQYPSPNRLYELLTCKKY